MLANGNIPDPFTEDNELKVQWVAESDWEYRRSFTLSSEVLAEERVYLVCDGLDTLANVSLNGHFLGHTENMFRQYHWEVKSLLKPGENEISITFESPIRYITPRHEARPMLGVSQAIPGGPYLRKAPCQFGWDWGPQLPPIGIWKDIRLEGYSLARFEDVHLRQIHNPEGAIIQAAYKLEKWAKELLTVSLTVTSPRGEVTTKVTHLEGFHGEVSIQIPNPELWWPNGYGKQPLYKINFTLSRAGKPLDEREYTLGFRTLELHREPDQWGESFTFVVNGVPIFAKGSNWIPADSFPTRITDEHLESLIKSAVAAHENMLRVWGGGFYEEDRFYKLCDRYGILVWQDCIFSCSVYPFDIPEFLENVRVEVAQNVSRLRHRTSFALWCGNNEMEQGWEMWGWFGKASQDRASYDQFFHKLLPEWIISLDPDHVYWPSSPSSLTPFENTNGQKQGDAHYWDVWHGRRPFTAYREQFPRFMSEFGFQSLPPLETVQTYADKKDWNMTSYIMEHHQRSTGGNGLMISQMTDTFRMPTSFPSLVYLSMVLQAEGIRYGVEHWRRNKQRVSGTLIWQLNDCWPVASWSSLDFFGRWKALHYAARRFYSPVLVSIEDQGQTMHVHVTSDVTAPFHGKIVWQLMALDGRVIESGEEAVSLVALESKKITSPSFNLNPIQSRSAVFISNLYQDGKLISTNLATFVPNKHLELGNPMIQTEVTQSGTKLVFHLSSHGLARFVELQIQGKDVVFSDNYFDLPAGTPIEVTCDLPEGMSLNEVKRALVIKSLYDSFS